jgi:SAM-dependent methyltransferase
MAEADDMATARAVYDASASEYVRAVGTELSPGFETPSGLVVLDTFLAAAAAVAGPIIDAGCGPGRVAAFVARRGVHVVGIDASSAMLTQACAAHPGLALAQCVLNDLPFVAGSASGVVCWYSIIHTPPHELDRVFGEVARVLRPDGGLLVAFQAGDGQAVARENAHGTGLTLTSYRHGAEDVVRRLSAAGFSVQTCTVRDPEFRHETSPQAFILARRRGSGKVGSSA